MKGGGSNSTARMAKAIEEMTKAVEHLTQAVAALDPALDPRPDVETTFWLNGAAVTEGQFNMVTRDARRTVLDDETKRGGL